MDLIRMIFPDDLWTFIRSFVPNPIKIIQFSISPPYFNDDLPEYYVGYCTLNGKECDYENKDTSIEIYSKTFARIGVYAKNFKLIGLMIHTNYIDYIKNHSVYPLENIGDGFWVHAGDDGFRSGNLEVTSKFEFNSKIYFKWKELDKSKSEFFYFKTHTPNEELTKMFVQSVQFVFLEKWT